MAVNGISKINFNSVTSFRTSNKEQEVMDHITKFSEINDYPSRMSYLNDVLKKIDKYPNLISLKLILYGIVKFCDANNIVGDPGGFGALLNTVNHWFLNTIRLSW